MRRWRHQAELAGTILNTLVHHGAGLDPQETERNVVSALKNREEGQRWLRETIETMRKR